MLNDLKKVIATGMLVIFSATMVFPGVAMAKQKEKVKGKEKTEKTEKHQKFKDIEKHWANKDLTKFSQEQIITGYQDGTFKPEKEVTTLEAVVMAVRALGLTDAANKHMDQSLPFKDAAAIPAWARGYVAVAIDEGLIDAENVFQPNKPATRMDATILLVRALDNLSDLDKFNAQLKFVDTLELSSQFKQYISQAVMNNLITGYQDKTFRPNGHITRAELVTLFARLLKENPIEDSQTRVVGVLTEIDLHDSVIHVKTTVSNPVIRELKVLPNADIYRNNVKVDLEDLEVQDKVEILLDAQNQVMFIDANATEEDEQQELLRGRITSIDTHDRIVTVNTNNVIRELRVLSSADIYRNGVRAALSDLKVEDVLDIFLNEQNQVVFIDTNGTNQNEQLTLQRGRITSIDTHDATITVNTNNVIKELSVLSSADIYRNNGRADLEDLKAQDDVDILLNEHNQVVFVDVKATVEVEVQKVLRGRIISIDTHDEMITVNLSNIIEVKFALADDVDIIRDGSEVSLSSLEVNDSVVLQQDDNGLITKITATDNE